MLEFKKYFEIMDFNMSISIAVRDMFFLSTGIAIIACDKLENSDCFLENGATIFVADKRRQKLKIIKEHLLINKNKNHGIFALEIEAPVDLTLDEVRSGVVRVVFD